MSNGSPIHINILECHYVCTCMYIYIYTRIYTYIIIYKNSCNFHCLPMECMEFHHPSIAHWDRGPSGFCTAYHWVMFNTTAVTSVSVLGETAVVGQAVVRGKVGAVGKLWDGPTFVYLCYSILWFYTICSSSRLMVWTSIFSFIWFMIYFKSLKSHPLQMA